MSQESLSLFCQKVFFDPLLQARLRELTDRREFIAATLQIAQEHGFEFTAQEVEASLNQGRRAWLERWF
jgi:predicted ribosomally synthesized peptide with nif11-like leader